MSFEAFSEGVRSFGSTVVTYARPVINAAVQWGGYAVSAVHAGSIEVVAKTSSLFAASGVANPAVGPAVAGVVVFAGTYMAVRTSQYLLDQESTLVRVAGLGLAIGAGAVAVGVVGSIIPITTTVGAVLSYVAGASVTASTILLR